MGKPEPPAPEWLMELAGVDLFADVVAVQLFDSEGRPDLEHLMENFEQLTELRLLYVHDTQVTDAGLEHVEGLADLEELALLRTQVTAEGIRELQKALPNCEIYWRPPTPGKPKSDRQRNTRLASLRGNPNASEEYTVSIATPIPTASPCRDSKSLIASSLWADQCPKSHSISEEQPTPGCHHIPVR